MWGLSSCSYPPPAPHPKTDPRKWFTCVFLGKEKKWIHWDGKCAGCSGAAHVPESRKGILRSPVSMWHAWFYCTLCFGCAQCSLRPPLSRELPLPGQTASEPLHWLFPLPGTSFPQIILWLVPSCHSGDRPDVTSSERPSVVTTPGCCLSHQLV